MNVNTLKEFELFFFINIIFDYNYINYPCKITLICILLPFLKVFLNIFMNFKQFSSYYIFIKISINIFYMDISIKFKYQYIYIYRYFHPHKKQPLKFV